MEISVSPKTKKLIDDASKKLNLNSEATITIALQSYLNSEDKGLKREFEMWENLGNEALENFEKSL